MAWTPFIDISEAQGRVDFDHMHSAGVGHLIVRGHNGTRRDHRVDEYIPAARAAGIVVVAVYGFINPKSSLTAAQQGEALAKICTQYEVATQMLDVEWYTGEPGRGVVLKGQFLAGWLRQMSDAAANITQARGIIYTGHAFWDNPATGPAVGGFGDHDLILADYPGYRASGDPLPRGVAPTEWWREAFRYKAHGPTVPAGWNGWDGWQFSAGYNAQGPVYGCSSNDLDLNFASAEAINRWASQSSQPVPVEPPVVANTTGKDDLMVVILAPRGANARFLAVMGATATGAQVAAHAEWLRSEAEMQPFLNNGVHVVECDVTDLANVSVDEVPHGDAIEWAPGNFRRVTG